MKKTILILILSITFLFGYSQTTVNLSATGTYSFTAYDRATIGSISIITSAAFNGTTTSANLQASNDGVNWFTVYADDNITSLLFTLTSGSNNYVWLLKTLGFAYYRINYVKGNASAGTVYATMKVK